MRNVRNLQALEVQKFTHLGGPIIIQCYLLTIHMKWVSRKILYTFLPSLRKKMNFPKKFPQEMMSFQQRRIYGGNH